MNGEGKPEVGAAISQRHKLDVPAVRKCILPGDRQSQARSPHVAVEYFSPLVERFKYFLPISIIHSGSSVHYI